MNIDAIIENAQLKGRIIALDAQVETLTAELRCLEAVVRAHERVDCQAVANLKAEVARLDDELKMEKENEDRLVREFQNANNEVYGLQRQVAALIDNQTRLNSLIANSEHENARLKAECQARQAENSVLAVECDSLKAEVERHIKARQNDDMATSEKEDPLLIPRHLVVWWMDECKKAQAQVERLTKAGDAIYQSFDQFGQVDAMTLKGWQAAKEKQS